MDLNASDSDSVCPDFFTAELAEGIHAEQRRGKPTFKQQHPTFPPTRDPSVGRQVFSPCTPIPYTLYPIPHTLYPMPDMN